MYDSSDNPLTAGPQAVQAAYGQRTTVDLPSSGHPLIDAIRSHLAGNQLSPQDQVLRLMYPAGQSGR